MRRARLWVVLIVAGAGCGGDSHLTDGPTGADAPTPADAPVVDGTPADGAFDAALADAAPPDAAPPDARPPDAYTGPVLRIDLVGTGKGAIGVQIESVDMPPCAASSCTYPIAPGDHIQLLASAASTFDSWVAPCTSTTMPFCNFVVTGETTVTASFTADPSEVVTFIRPTISATEPATEVSADGRIFVTDGTTLAETDAGGTELWSIPLVGATVQMHAGPAADTVPDGAGGFWILYLATNPDNVDADHYDASSTLIAAFPDVGYYDAVLAADPSTGIPVVASTGHSTWKLVRPGSAPIQSENLGDFPGDIDHGALLDSTNAIIAVRWKGILGPGGIKRVRYSATGTLLESITHPAYAETFGISPKAIAAGPDGIVVYSGELWIGTLGSGTTIYPWIQVVDYTP